MDHVYPAGENSFHKESLDCPCKPVMKWKEDICIHLPLTINLHGITDKDDADFFAGDDQTEDE